MWRLYQTAKTTRQRPSNLVGVVDRWTALQFDNAVVMIGTAIENAAQEQEKVGGDEHPRWQAKYTMAQLMDPDFRLPLSQDDADANIDELIDMAGGYFDEVDGSPGGKASPGGEG